jgi:hypothetical protein
LEKEIKPSDTLKYIFLSMAGVTAVILVVGLFVSSKPLSFTLGLLFGAVISVVRIIMLAKSVDKAVDMEPNDSKLYMTGQYHLRMLLMVVAVVAGAMTRGVISVVGIALGLIAMQPSVYIANFIYERLGGKKIESVSAKKADRDS